MSSSNISEKSSSLASLSNTLIGSETDFWAKETRQKQGQDSLNNMNSFVRRSDIKKDKFGHIEQLSHEEIVLTFLPEDGTDETCSGQLRRRLHTGVVSDGIEVAAEEGCHRQSNSGGEFFKLAVERYFDQNSVELCPPHYGYENLPGIKFALFATSRSSKVLLRQHSVSNSCDTSLNKDDI